jgi:predicted TIM-barrel enzyme
MGTEAHIRHLSEKRKRGEAIIVAGVGSGLTARAAAMGGADLIATYNTAIYRIQGIPTALAFFPYDNCNILTMSIAPQVLAAAGTTPVLLGFGAHDPRQPIESLVEKAMELGAAGITNEPFLGMYQGDLKNQLEAAGLGFGRELTLISTAVKRGLLGMGWAFTPTEAAQMAIAGAQVIGAMVGGITSGGAAGGSATIPLDTAAKIIEEIVAAVNKEGGDIPVLMHGGPLNDPSSVGELFKRTGAAGYVTGSTGERLPVERSVADTVARFKRIRKG